jgi:hypothetical protein
MILLICVGTENYIAGQKHMYEKSPWFMNYENHQITKKKWDLLGLHFTK